MNQAFGVFHIEFDFGGQFFYVNEILHQKEKRSANTDRVTNSYGIQYQTLDDTWHYYLDGDVVLT